MKKARIASLFSVREQPSAAAFPTLTPFRALDLFGAFSFFHLLRPLGFLHFFCTLDFLDFLDFFGLFTTLHTLGATDLIALSCFATDALAKLASSAVRPA